jgi:hypothetical protein
MARTYKRDSRGRFAGGGGGGGGATKGKGTLAARSSLKRSRAKLASAPSAAQRGAVTRGSNKLKAAKAASRTRLQGPAGRFRPGKAKSAGPAGAASNIRRTGGLKRLEPANKISGTKRPRRAPLIARANAIREFNPKTPGAKIDQLNRKIGRKIDSIKDSSQKMKAAVTKADKLRNKLQRANADAITNRGKKGWRGDIARMEMNTIGSRMGMKAMKRRMQRAADAAARGSKAGKRAQEIYANQVAFTGKGKAKAAKSNIRPGPRNTQGPPPKRRKPRKPRKS